MLLKTEEKMQNYSDGYLASIGNFDGDGANVNRNYPDNDWNNKGFSLL